MTELILIVIALLCGFIVGVWFTMGMKVYFLRIPYVITDPDPEIKS